MLIFIDTNILYNDFYMKNVQFELIRKVGTIVLGEIIIDEACKKYRERLIESYNALKNDERSINGLIHNPLNISSIDIESEIQEYRNFLEMYAFDRGMGETIEYPTVSHKDVVARAIIGKKPFKPDGKDGYRDYMVWLSCLELAKRYTSEEIHFITQNIADFSADNKEKKKVLHNDLLEDLEKNGIENSRFHYWTNLKEFIEQSIKPQIAVLENEESIKRMIESLITDTDILQDYINNNIIGLDLTPYDLLLPCVGSSLKSIDSSDIEIDEITEIDEKHYLIELTINGICNIEGKMLLSEYYKLVKEYKQNEWVIDFDVVEKNEDTVTVQVMMQLYIHVNGKYSTSDKTISSLQLDYIEDSYCDFCSY